MLLVFLGWAVLIAGMYPLARLVAYRVNWPWQAPVGMSMILVVCILFAGWILLLQHKGYLRGYQNPSTSESVQKSNPSP